MGNEFKDIEETNRPVVASTDNPGDLQISFSGLQFRTVFSRSYISTRLADNALPIPAGDQVLNHSSLILTPDNTISEFPFLVPTSNFPSENSVARDTTDTSVLGFLRPEP